MKQVRLVITVSHTYNYIAPIRRISQAKANQYKASKVKEKNQC